VSESWTGIHMHATQLTQPNPKFTYIQPPSIAIFFILMVFVGIMEGMQIAAFAVLRVPEAEYKDTHKIAHTNCQLMFKGDNLQLFLVGRQLLVTLCMFVVAKIATIDKDKWVAKHPDANIFGVSDGFQTFIETGLLGALVTTIIGSLIWRVIAGSKPLTFMSNPVIFVIIWACFGFSWSGILNFSWVLGWIQKKILRWERDEFYLGEEMVTKEKKAKEEEGVEAV